MKRYLWPSLLILFFVSTSNASEGLFLPSQRLLSRVQKETLFSTVAFKAGSGVVIENNLLVTAAHVAGGCGCPKNGVPVPCEKEFRIPEIVSVEGIVTKWKLGKTREVIGCGLNANVDRISLYNQVLARVLPNEDFGGFASGKFWPREDLMVLSFDKSLRLPEARLRSAPMGMGEPLYLLGYPGLSLRSRNLKRLRLEVLEESRQEFASYENLLNLLDIETAISKIEQRSAERFKKFSVEVDALPKNSDRRTALMAGPLAFYPSILNLLTFWKKQAAKPVCFIWQLEDEPCYLRIWKGFLKADIEGMESSIARILKEAPAEYPEADKSLRISFGHFKFYQKTRDPEFFGGISTDLDGVSGNSGGPVFDKNGNLVGIVATGPELTALTYVENSGINGPSHNAIQDLLSKQGAQREYLFDK
jgi:hypothetical protein